MKIIKNQDVSWGKIPRSKRTEYNEELRERVIVEGYDYLDRITAGNYNNIELVDPFIFQAVTNIENMGRGRSAAHFHALDEEGNTFTLHMASLLDIIKSVGIESNGYVSGYWQFRKRGQNFGIEFIGKGN